MTEGIFTTLLALLSFVIGGAIVATIITAAFENDCSKLGATRLNGKVIECRIR